MGGARAAILARYRTDMGDGAAACRLQQRQEHLRDHKGPLEVGVHDHVPVGIRDGVEIGRLVDAGIVDQDLYRPKGARLFGGAFHLQAVGDIHLHGQGTAAFCLDLFGHGMGLGMFFAIGQQHIGPGIRQTQRNGSPDPARSARDHGAFALKRKPIHLRFSTRLAAAAICGAAIS